MLALPAAAEPAGVRSAESRAAARAVRVRAAGGSAGEPAPHRPAGAVRVVRVQARGLRPAGRDRVAARRRDDHARRVRRARTCAAGSERDAWFGAGYAVAQDRLVELELFRRSTQGRLAEVLGESRLASDIVARRDYYTRAELRRQLNRQPADLRARFDAYAEGVNAWLARVARRPGAAPARARAARADAGAVDAARLGGDRRPARPHGAERRRRGAGELARAARARRQAVRPAAAAAPARRAGHRARVARAASRPSPAARGATRSAASRRLAPVPAEGVKPPKRGRRARRPAPRAAARSTTRSAAPGGSAYLFTAPQLGFSIPELFVELEVHAPGLDVRGVTGPGIPVIAAGHNGRIAWGITSGLDDDDDLYVERLAGRERYRFKGRTRRMNCRTETFAVAGEKSVRQRFCRTVHGPVQARAGRRTAYARRYAIWGREVRHAAGAGGAQRRGLGRRGRTRRRAKLTWNENLLVADDAGHIGWWHPGRLPLRPEALGRAAAAARHRPGRVARRAPVQARCRR